MVLIRMTGTKKATSVINVVNENRSRRSDVNMDSIAKEEETVQEPPEITPPLDEKARHFNILSSRLKEQSNLIKILKEQIRNTEIKIANHEGNKNLETYRNSTLSKLKEQMKQYKTLKDRYSILQNNFLEIKAITEQYKNKNKLLTDELKTLEISNEKIFGTARSEILDQVESLKKTHSDHKEQCKLIEEKIDVQESLAEEMEKNLQEDMKTQKKNHKEEMEKLMSKLKDIQNISQEAERTLKLESKYYPKQHLLEREIEKLQKEKEVADDEMAYNEKVLQFEQKENAKLIENINTLKKTITQLETQFKEKVKMVQSDSLVISLQQEIRETHLNYKKTQKEIEIYKDESRKKLEWERKLNEKLRHIPG